MPLWKFVPAARRSDPRWQDREPWYEVVVRAETAAMARVTASGLDRPRGPDHVGNESIGFRSAFDDEKLYWVERIDAREFDAARSGPLAGIGESGPPEIVRAIQSPPGGR